MDNYYTTGHWWGDALLFLIGGPLLGVICTPFAAEGGVSPFQRDKNGEYPIGLIIYFGFLGAILAGILFFMHIVDMLEVWSNNAEYWHIFWALWPLFFLLSLIISTIQEVQSKKSTFETRGGKIAFTIIFSIFFSLVPTGIAVLIAFFINL